MGLLLLFTLALALAGDDATEPPAAPTAEPPAAEPPAEPTAPPEPTPVSAAPSLGLRTIHWIEIKVKKQAQPSYPKEAKNQGIEGDCRLRFFINEKGKTTDVRVESCPEVFQEAALEAAWKYSFYPHKVNGVATPVEFVVLFRFRIF